jgi:hypothetical protein
MNIWYDDDLVAFGIAVARTLMVAPGILRQRDPIPAEYAPEEVRDESMTEKQRSFFQSYDRKLAEMNYFPVCTYRVANYQRNLLRRYASPIDPAYCIVMAMEVKFQEGGQPAWAPVSLITFRTDFTNGISLTTRNKKLKTLLDHYPTRLVQECPYADEPATLKKLHEAKVAGMGIAQPFPTDVARVFENVRAEHREFAQHQVERGLYRRDAQGGFALTNKTHWRAIRNHFNPFVQRVPPPKMALCALLAVGIPVAVYWALATGTQAYPAAYELPFASEGVALFFVSYVLAGAVIGFLIGRNPFLWSFLLTYLCVHLCTGWWFSAVPFSSVAAAVAYQVKRMRQRQRLMLQAKPAAGRITYRTGQRTGVKSL